MKIAALQVNAVFADVNANMEDIAKLVENAVADGAELVLLPEFFTSAIGFSEKMLTAVMQNQVVKTRLCHWAHDYNVIIGGSYIDFDGNDAYNRFLLCFPNGSTFEHKKDIPTQFENCYYTDGDKNHILHTPIGNIGIALCWEMIRFDTIRRMTGKVDIVLAGSCWWDLPEDAPLERQLLREYNQRLAAETPVTFAKLLQVPVIHASHCGKVTAFRFPNADTIQTRQLVGATQIISGTGAVIRRKSFNEGQGIICADIIWDVKNRKTFDYPSKYWIPDLPDSYLNAWDMMNPIGKKYYNDISLKAYKVSLG